MKRPQSLPTDCNWHRDRKKAYEAAFALKIQRVRFMDESGYRWVQWNPPVPPTIVFGQVLDSGRPGYFYERGVVDTTEMNEQSPLGFRVPYDPEAEQDG